MWGIFLQFLFFNIGKGLYSSKDIPPNKVIVFFDGVKRSLREYQDLYNDGKGGYAHHFGKNYIYDCFNRVSGGKDLCIASMANSALNLSHSETGKKAKNNAKKVFKNGKLYLISLKKVIKAQEEIFFPYGKYYKMQQFLNKTDKKNS